MTEPTEYRDEILAAYARMHELRRELDRLEAEVKGLQAQQRQQSGTCTVMVGRP